MPELELRVDSADSFDPGGVGRVGAQKAITGIWNAGKELCATHWIVPGSLGNHSPKRVGLKFIFLRIGACADRSAKPSACIDISTDNACQNRPKNCAALCGFALLCEVAFNMVRRFMTQDKGQLVTVACFGHQSHGEADHWASGLVQCLEGIGGLATPIINDDLEIAILVWRADPAFALRHGFYRCHDCPEVGLRHCGGHFRGLIDPAGIALLWSGLAWCWLGRCGRCDLAARQSDGCGACQNKSHVDFASSVVAIDPIASERGRQANRTSQLLFTRGAALVWKTTSTGAPGVFTIEHEFDASVITLVDEGETHLKEDVTVNTFEDCITIEQFDPVTDRLQRVTLSMRQARDLAAALNLPEGAYRLNRT